MLRQTSSFKAETEDDISVEAVVLVWSYSPCLKLLSLFEAIVPVWSRRPLFKAVVPCLNRYPSLKQVPLSKVLVWRRHPCYTCYIFNWYCNLIKIRFYRHWNESVIHVFKFVLQYLSITLIMIVLVTFVSKWIRVIYIFRL